MTIVVRAFTSKDQDEILGWRYEPPYDVYNVYEREVVDEPADAAEMCALEEDGELMGFCSFGADARVAGGSYPDGPLDIGIGIRPDLTGRGQCSRYLAAVLTYATSQLIASS